jgi:hypothetical protein
MKLDEHYKLKNDTYNWTLKYKSEPKFNEKTKKEYHTSSEWYFPSLHMALSKYVDENLKASKDIIEILNRLENLTQIILNIKK